MRTCVDASLALKWLTSEPGSDEAVAWLSDRARDEILAPVLLPIEVASVLRQKVHRAEMAFADGLRALALLEKLKIHYEWDWSLLERAFSLAAELNQPTAYDTAYLALAERSGCELWTMDGRFARAASAKYPQVRLLGA